MPLPRSSFVTFPEPFTALLDLRKVANSWPSLHQYGIRDTEILVAGVSQDETTILVGGVNPSNHKLVPQVAKRVLIFNPQKYNQQVLATGIRGKASAGQQPSAVPAS